MKTAVIIVDVQNDFVEGGALAVTGGKAIIPAINRIITVLKDVLVITTQDWHPADTPHFKMWPVHCVAGTVGAELVPELAIDQNAIRIFKGQGAADGYSGFDGQTDPNEGAVWLNTLLQANHIDHVYVCGLATDYCVKATVMDAVKFGYKTSFVRNAAAGVAEDTTTAAETEMAKAGVQFINLY